MGRNNTFTSSSRFTDYATVVAALTDLSKSNQSHIPMYTIGSDGDDSSIIGYWGWNENPVVADRIIVPQGLVRFNKVTPSKYGLISVVDGDGTHCTLTGGHTLPASGVAYVWDTSLAVAHNTAVAFTVGGDTLTVATTAGWAAGDQMWIADTELCVGTGCAVQLASLEQASFVETGISCFGRPIQVWAGKFAAISSQKLFVASSTALSATGKMTGIGWWVSAANHIYYGLGRHSDGSSRTLTVENGSLTYGSLVSSLGGVVWTGCYGAGVGSESRIGGTGQQGSFANWKGINLALYDGIASLRFIADDGAVFSEYKG